jgi:hypothetical protein
LTPSSLASESRRAGRTQKVEAVESHLNWLVGAGHDVRGREEGRPAYKKGLEKSQRDSTV